MKGNIESVGLGWSIYLGTSRKFDILNVTGPLSAVRIKTILLNQSITRTTLAYQPRALSYSRSVRCCQES